jgi:hypothetical protein
MYGVEYSDLSCTLAEVARVLKPNGQCLLVMHHPQSIITKQSTITLEVINSLLQEPMLNGFTDIALDNSDALRHVCFQVLTKHLHQLPENAQDDVKLIGQNVYNILQSNDALVDLIQHLRLLGQDLTAQAQRLALQIEAAQQVAQLQSIDFKSSFTNWKFSTLDFNESPIATTMTVVK